MKKHNWIVVVFSLVAAQQWVGAQAFPGGGAQPGGAQPGGGNTGGGNTGGPRPGGGGTNSVRRIPLNNGYAKGVANYGVNQIQFGGRNPRTITPRITIQDFSKRGARILLRGYRIVVLSGGNTGGGNTGGGTTAVGMSAPAPGRNRPAPVPQR